MILSLDYCFHATHCISRCFWLGGYPKRSCWLLVEGKFVLWFVDSNAGLLLWVFNKIHAQLGRWDRKWWEHTWVQISLYGGWGHTRTHTQHTHTHIYTQTQHCTPEDIHWHNAFPGPLTLTLSLKTRLNPQTAHWKWPVITLPKCRLSNW